MKTSKNKLSGCLFNFIKLFKRISLIIFIISFIVFIILSANYIYCKSRNIDITATSLKIIFVITFLSMFAAYSDVLIKKLRDFFKKNQISIIILLFSITILFSTCGIPEKIEKGNREYNIKLRTTWVVVDSVITGKYSHTYWTYAMPGRYYVFEDQELFQKGDTVRFSMSRCSRALIVYDKPKNK